MWQFHQAFQGSDNRTYTWSSHYRQAQFTDWSGRIRATLEDEQTPQARRGQIRAQLAAFTHLMAEPDFNVRASMIGQGTVNMPINRFFAMPFAAVLIPDHPLANQWLDVAAGYVRFKLGQNVAPLGAWAEPRSAGAQ